MTEMAAPRAKDASTGHEPDDPVLTERLGHVLLITLNRPQARNAITAHVAATLGAALDLLHQDPVLRVDVFSSEDAREGAIAFAEKRDPVWRGR